MVSHFYALEFLKKGEGERRKLNKKIQQQFHGNFLKKDQRMDSITMIQPLVLSFLIEYAYNNDTQ